MCIMKVYIMIYYVSTSTMYMICVCLYVLLTLLISLPADFIIRFGTMVLKALISLCFLKILPSRKKVSQHIVIFNVVGDFTSSVVSCYNVIIVYY